MKFDKNIEGRYGITLIDEFNVRKTATSGTRENFKCIQAIVNHFIHNPDDMVVPTYNFNVIEATSESPESNFGRFSYTYDMMRLGMLDEDERNIIDISGRYYHVGLSVDTPNIHIKEGCKTYPKLIKFMNTVFSMGRYNDVHSGNFMKDEEGNYRIIDLEGFVTTPLESAGNDWIIR